MSTNPILVINTGSSSLKFGLYTSQGGEEQVLLEGLADGIGRDTGKLELKGADGHLLRSESLRVASQAEALAHAASWLAELSPDKPRAVGHRVVHGGPRLLEHQRITSDVINELEACLHFAPLHIPLALDLIRAAEASFPELPQFACFDTAFHRTVPETASRFALPRDLYGEGIRRYGFHGLSYESIVQQLGPDLPSRTVIAHLGSGASLAAIKDGRSVDTSMGLTPTGGIPMATRTGDLDPGVLLFLLRVKHLDPDALESLLNHDSGLKALSGGTSDMRDLELAAKAGDGASDLAIEIFCNAISKTVAAYTTVLDGLDMLVFSGGIGEHSAVVRQRVCRKLASLGVPPFDDSAIARPSGNSPPLHNTNVQVCVVPSEEDRQIARHCRAMLMQP